MEMGRKKGFPLDGFLFGWMWTRVEGFMETFDKAWATILDGYRDFWYSETKKTSPSKTFGAFKYRNE